MRRTASVIGALVIVIATAVPAWAATASASGDSLVVLTGDGVVPEGDVVDTVVVFDGAATIAGHVRESVVVFSGKVTITGEVDRDVIVFDGPLTIRAGASVGGDVYATPRTIDPGATIGGEVGSIEGLGVGITWAGILVGVLVWASIAISVLILGLLLILLVPRAADVVATAGVTAVGPVIGWGFAAFFGIPILAVIAMSTLVGLPLGLLVLLSFALLLAIGQATGAWILGRQMVRERSRALAFLAGWGVLTAISLVPAAGPIAWFAATVYGLGAIAVAIWRARSAAPAPTPEVPSVPAMPGAD